ncbi:MAG: hemolysin family protein [Spirochaetaceae bacterium]|nr:hemolysin family protein [Spirochaetaceae bacterium]
MSKKSDSKKPTIDKKIISSLDSDQQEMIRGVVELEDTAAREVMVPRIDTVFISAAATREELLSAIVESGHSRFPVYEDTVDKVTGILYAKDVLKALVKNGEVKAQELLRKPFFVPESKRIHELLREFRRRRVHIAVVVDEYGGVSGIICMENILEQIIGDIQDEFDNEQEDILSVGEGVWLCDARVNLEDLGEELGIEFPVEEFDTLGGFVFDLFGKIPVKYEKVLYRGIEFIIQNMEGPKIGMVKIVQHDGNL